MILHEHTFSWQPCPIPARQLQSIMLQAEWDLLREKREAVWLSAAQRSAVSQSVASHQVSINPPPPHPRPPTSLLSRQTLTDVLRYKAIIYQPPRLFNPCCSTRPRHGTGSGCHRLFESEIATSVEHGQAVHRSGKWGSELTWKKHCCCTHDTKSDIILLK